MKNDRISLMAAVLFAVSISAASAQVIRVVGARSIQIGGDQLTVSFVLPISPESTWRWHLAESKAGRMEYSWRVGIELGPDKYEMGITCFQPKPKGSPASGTLHELLLRCQKDVWVINPDGTAEAANSRSKILVDIGGVDGRQPSMTLRFTDKNLVPRIRQAGLQRAALITQDPESHDEVREQVNIDYLP